MKKLKTVLVVIFYLLLSTFNSSAQNVGINATGAAPDASALLDLSATNKGFLITRVDTASIPSPAFGLMTLAPSDSCLYMYSGVKWISLGGAGTNCSCNCSTTSPPPPPTFTGCIPTASTVLVPVTNPITGKIWMDRNLGASQAATSSTDTAAYGCLYQWGRAADGHEDRASGTTTTLSATDTPGHSNFITTSANPNDWRSPQNNSLWQGVSGINNPCPTGYRIPTLAELDAERLSWSTNNAAGAYASPLKFTVAGLRISTTAALSGVGSLGYYRSSTTAGIDASNLYFDSSTTLLLNNDRAMGFSVRCIKN